MARSNVRQTTIREVLDSALELERKTMALYAALVQQFRDEPELSQFWFNMARIEAVHCGGLMLVESILEADPDLGSRTKIMFDTQVGIRLRSLLQGYGREVRRGVTAQRSFEMALDLESSELEDVVVDLLQVVEGPWRDEAVKLLVHEMGELSYMIERFCDDERLQSRADALVERRAERGGN